MELLIMAKPFNGEKDEWKEYDIDPDNCPICHSHIMPKKYIGALSERQHTIERLQILFRCTRRTCDSFFIGIYKKDYSDRIFYLHRLTPMSFQEEVFNETIVEVSPSFVQIYNQAVAAESAELTEIAGIGYRKSLEFLIKDFAIMQNPNDEEAIKKTFLGTVINCS
jgi:hypothetical protein